MQSGKSSTMQKMHRFKLKQDSFGVKQDQLLEGMVWVLTPQQKASTDVASRKRSSLPSQTPLFKVFSNSHRPKSNNCVISLVIRVGWYHFLQLSGSFMLNK
jgi:hypothetical protein